MIDATIVREELKNIRYYYARRKTFDETSNDIGKNSIADIAEKYNAAVCNAPPRLYDLYISLYIKNGTQEAVSCEMGYTPEYIRRLNQQLVQFLQKELSA